MKKIVALMLSLSMTLLLCACGVKSKDPADSNAAPEQNGIYKAGTYEGSAEGFGGTLTVSVTLSTDKIEKVEVKSHQETEGVGTKAIDALPGEIVAKNSTDVDTVSGATMSSNAIIAAVKDAMKEFSEEVPSTALEDGVYPGESTGYQGPLKVEVTIADEKITDINVLENVETVGIGSKALDAVPKSIIENQSVAVDALSGATASSKAVLAAVTNALETAGADLSKYNVKPVIQKGEDKVVEADVVIVGAGGAGLTAAIEAKTGGASSVVIIEKMDITGGNTRMSGGEFAAPGNWVQLAQGIKNDSVEKYYNDIMKGGYNLGNPDLVRIIAENALPTAEWLKDYVGVKYRDEQSWYGGHEVARTLWPVGDGPAYVDTLEEKARELGVEIYLQTEATELIQDASKRVTGVKALHKDGANYTFHANNGVIIATGGFGKNVEMREKYNTMWPTLDASVPSTNSPAITGDGIRMAMEIGANTVGMENIQLYPVNNPATGNYYYIDYARLNSTALLVNKEGKRFVNEKGTRDVISDATLKQTDSMVYEIIDADVVKEQELYETYAAEIALCQKNGVLAIGTLEEVCAHFDVPADVVKETIEHYNSLVDAGEDKDFGRTDNFNKIGEGPYFMFSSVVSVHHTMGGVQIDTDARVIDKDGNPIAGLYAAGEVTGGIHGGNRLGSVAVPDTAIFGRIAANSCLAGK
ncbi:MAG: flavocytochrome c [Lachnospiraceae bacterium]|nr:flavocytochrome c [Lachnospiraceae bacterium]